MAERDRQLTIFLSDCAQQYRLTHLNQAILNLAIDLTQRHPLRAYDSVQLATAIIVNRSLVAHGLPPLVFVTADGTLITAAQSEGLTVDNPNWHP